MKICFDSMEWKREMRSRNGKRKVKIMEQNIENTQSIAEPMSRQKKVAAINDLTGYGRCALTVSLPVISHEAAMLSGSDVNFIQSYRVSGVLF